MNNDELKRPGIPIAILQLISFVALYEVIAIGIGWFASLIGQLADLVPIFNPLHILAKPSEGILYSITPIVIVYCLFYTTSFVFKKYLFSIVSVMLHFMLIAYLSIDIIVEQIQLYGFISWETVNRVWFALLLCAAYLYLFVARSDVRFMFSKFNLE